MIKDRQKIAKKINKILGMKKNPIGALAWWFQPNGRLPQNRTPWDQLLNHNVIGLLDIVEDLVEWGG